MESPKWRKWVDVYLTACCGVLAGLLAAVFFRCASPNMEGQVRIDAARQIQSCRDAYQGNSGRHELLYEQCKESASKFCTAHGLEKGCWYP